MYIMVHLIILSEKYVATVRKSSIQFCQFYILIINNMSQLNYVVKVSDDKNIFLCRAVGLS